MTPSQAAAAGGGFRFVVTQEDGWAALVSRLLPEEEWQGYLQVPNTGMHMDFCNSHQFDTTGPIGFRVIFEDGCATKIEKMTEVLSRFSVGWYVGCRSSFGQLSEADVEAFQEALVQDQKDLQ